MPATQVIPQLLKFKAILSMINPPLIGYNTENGATLQGLPEKSPNSEKKQKAKKFAKTTGVNEPDE